MVLHYFFQQNVVTISTENSTTLAWKHTNVTKMLHKRSNSLVFLYLCLMQLMCHTHSDSVKKDIAYNRTHLAMRYSKRNADSEPVKYPKNHQIISANVRRFQQYYKCLNESKIKPAAHYALSGTSISLHCHACVSPQGNSIQWKYANKATNFTEKFVQLDVTVNRHSDTLRSTLTNDGLILNLFGLSMAESGHYTCLQDGNVITPHLVQVANSTEKLSRVKPITAPKGPYATPPFNLTDLDVKVWFKWSEWSTCSRCDQIGKRIQIGICMVTLSENNNRTEAKILQVFPEGIPCLSNLQPTTIKNHPKIESIRNEYMVGFCKERCSQNKRYFLKETGGALLKKMGNLSDPYTFIQRLPYVPPPIKHSSLYHNQWDTAHIQCPGSDHNNAPVHWRLGLNLILTENERVHLTPTHILVIDNLGISDSNVYSCWQRNRLVGIVRLKVSQPIRLSFEEQLNAVVLIAIIISFVIISMRILRAYLKRRRLATSKK